MISSNKYLRGAKTLRVGASLLLTQLAVACAGYAPEGSVETEETSQLQDALVNCGTELGIAPLQNACGHGWVGPFGDIGGVGSPATPIAANANLTFSGATPALASAQVNYRLTLPGTTGNYRGAVKFTAQATQDYSIATDLGVPVTVRNSSGTLVASTLTDSIGDNCAEIGTKLAADPDGKAMTRLDVFPLQAGQTYHVAFGPAATATLNVEIDEPNDYLNVYFADADADGFGGFYSPIVSECKLPAGAVSNDGDCNDSSAAVSPVANEVSESPEVDNDCDGLTSGETTESDLILVSVNAVNTLGQIPVGGSATVYVRQVVSSTGIVPTDGLVQRVASSTGVATVLPASASSEARNIEYNELREILTPYQVTCASIGSATITVDADLSPLNAGDVDPDLSNNEGSTTFNVQCVPCIHANQQIVSADRNKINAGQVLAGSYFELGENGSKVTGNVAVRGNAYLRIGAKIQGNIHSSGPFLYQGNAAVDVPVSGTTTQNTPLPYPFPAVPQKTVTTGPNDLNVANNASATWVPGNYDEGTLGTGSTVTLTAGTYNFRRLIVNPDADVLLNTGAGDILINVEQQFESADRTSFERMGNGLAAIYTNDQDGVRIGTNVLHFDASLSAPRSTVNVYSFTTINGCIAGNNLRFEPDVAINQTPTPGSGTMPPSCSDGLQNGAETGVDCGGTCANLCAPTCTDGVQNGAETGVDCGGSCAACPPTCTATTYEAETMFHSTGSAVTNGWGLYQNGYVTTQSTFAGGATSVVVHARGTAAGGVWPHMVLSVGGTVVGQTSVNATNFTAYTFNFSTSAGSKEIRITFDNDALINGQDRNLFLDKAIRGCASGGGGSSLTASFNKRNEWGSGYCGDVIIQNTGSSATTSWRVVLNTNQSSTYSRWNAVFSANSGIITLTPVSWNAVIPAGGTISSPGFCANRVPGTSGNPLIVQATAL